MQIDYARLQGTFVRLEQLNATHVETLRKLARDPRLWEYTRSLIVDDTFDKQFDTYIGNAFSQTFSPVQVPFVMRDQQSGDVMGMTRFYKMDLSQKRVSIGYTWYIPPYWGRVHNKECKLLLVQYAIETLSCQRVELEVAGQNLRSQKAVAKIGGVKEGVLRKHGVMADGTVRDTVVFSIIDDEWPSTKNRLRQMVADGAAAEKGAPH